MTTSKLNLMEGHVRELLRMRELQEFNSGRNIVLDQLNLLRQLSGSAPLAVTLNGLALTKQTIGPITHFDAFVADQNAGELTI